MNPYPSYKDSGVEWIGEIPAGWEILNGSYIGSYSKGKGIKKDEVVEVGHPCVRYGEIYTNYELKIHSTISFISDETTTNSVSVKTRTLLLTGSGETKEKIGKCIVYLGDEILWVGGDIIVIKPTEYIDSLFLSYLINSECLRVQREMSCKGEIVVHIYSKNFKEMKYPIPPISEQTKIAEYLDNKTKKIDELIEKTERKIDLLKEKRISLINHCVTKGLNPDVEMIDSSVEWIGEIPSEWNSTPIKYILEGNKDSIKTGPFGSQLKSDDMVSEGIKIYNQRTVYDENFTKGEIYITPEKYESMKGFTVINGDILISSRGTIGKMTIVPNGSEIGVLHPCLIRLRVDTNLISKKYLWWYMNHSSLFIESVKYESNSTTIDVIYSNVLTEIKFPLPSNSEQIQIVEYLDKQTQKIDSIIEKETKRIELLKEYRQSLIFEVVTGKVIITGNL